MYNTGFSKKPLWYFMLYYIIVFCYKRLTYIFYKLETVDLITLCIYVLMIMQRYFFCMNLNYVHYLVCDISYIMLPSNHIFVIFNISLFTEVTSDKHTMTSVYIFNVINVTDGPIQSYLSLW